MWLIGLFISLTLRCRSHCCAIGIHLLSALPLDVPFQRALQPSSSVAYSPPTSYTGDMLLGGMAIVFFPLGLVDCGAAEEELLPW